MSPNDFGKENDRLGDSSISVFVVHNKYRCELDRKVYPARRLGPAYGR